MKITPRHVTSQTPPLGDAHPGLPRRREQMSASSSITNSVKQMPWGKGRGEPRALGHTLECAAARWKLKIADTRKTPSPKTATFSSPDPSGAKECLPSLQGRDISLGRAPRLCLPCPALPLPLPCPAPLRSAVDVAHGSFASPRTRRGDRRPAWLFIIVA